MTSKRTNQTTPKVFDRFSVIQKFEKEKGREPVYREMCEMFNLKSISTAHYVWQKYRKWKK